MLGRDTIVTLMTNHGALTLPTSVLFVETGHGEYAWDVDDPQLLARTLRLELSERREKCNP